MQLLLEQVNVNHCSAMVLLDGEIIQVSYFILKCKSNSMPHGGSLCHPHFEKTSLRDTVRPLSCNGVFSKWG